MYNYELKKLRLVKCIKQHLACGTRSVNISGHSYWGTQGSSRAQRGWGCFSPRSAHLSDPYTHALRVYTSGSQGETCVHVFPFDTGKLAGNRHLECFNCSHLHVQHDSLPYSRRPRVELHNIALDSQTRARPWTLSSCFRLWGHAQPFLPAGQKSQKGCQQGLGLYVP